jgi:hypothetical protein
MPWARTGATNSRPWPTNGYVSGPLDTDTLTVDYSGCTKSILTYNDSVEPESEDVEYEDGIGTIVFNDDGSFTRHEDRFSSG